MASIFETLSNLGVACKEQQEVFSDRTRDRADVPVFRDKQSGVIYIDGFYGGDEVYEDGAYRQTNLKITGARDYEIVRDAERRSKAYQQYVCGKNVLDFGCGDGAFLFAVRHEAGSLCGIELQQDYIDALNAADIPCHQSLDRIPSQEIETAVSFHVLEHLPEPLPILRALFRVLQPGGTLIVEVPHANDFLLSKAKSDAFKQFTLWSQHLVLHTRESLKRLLAAGGFEQISVEGVQRYPLSNHLTWLTDQKPGGHKTPLALIDTVELTAAYEAALNRIDATDTLVAVAKKPA